MTLREIHCPQCRKPTPWEGNDHRPFCSERCRLIDLGSWSDESYRIFGYEPGEVEPAPGVFFKRFHPADRIQRRKAVMDALLKEKAYAAEFRLLLPDNRERIVREQVVVVRQPNGRPRPFMLIATSDASSRLVDASQVNRVPCSLLKISGRLVERAISRATRHNRLSIVFESRHDGTKQVHQSTTATRYRKP